MAIAAVTALTLTSTLAKYLTDGYDVPQILWARYIFFLLPLLILVSPTKWSTMARTNRPLLQIGRALLVLLSGGLFVVALRTLPLANATLIMFVMPLFLTILSIPLLGERVRLPQWIAVSCGFLGVTIAIGSNESAFQWSSLLVLSAAFLIALYQISTRFLGRDATPRCTLFYTGAVGTVLMTLTLPFFWQTPTLEGWLLMVALGLTYGAGQYLWILALTQAKASILAPFVYTKIIVAALLGLLVFGEVPSLRTWIGGVIIIGAGLFVVRRTAPPQPVNARR